MANYFLIITTDIIPSLVWYSNIFFIASSNYIFNCFGRLRTYAGRVRQR